jgi:hypothetical protein
MLTIGALFVVAIATIIIYRSVSVDPPCLVKNTIITVDVYGAMTRNLPFKAGQTSITVQGINVVLRC